jgi:hypothetical protein
MATTRQKRQLAATSRSATRVHYPSRFHQTAVLRWSYSERTRSHLYPYEEVVYREGDRWRGHERRVAVTHGYFVFTEWNVPADSVDKTGRPPEAIRYVRSDGSEEQVSADPMRKRAWDILRDLWERDRGLADREE